MGPRLCPGPNSQSACDGLLFESGAGTQDAMRLAMHSTAMTEIHLRCCGSVQEERQIMSRGSLQSRMLTFFICSFRPRRAKGIVDMDVRPHDLMIIKDLQTARRLHAEVVWRSGHFLSS